MEFLTDLLLNQIGIQGVFFVFTLILAKVFYDEKKEDKEEFKEREKNSEKHKAELTAQLEKSNAQIGKCIETISKFEKNFEVINGKLDQLSEKVQ